MRKFEITEEQIKKVCNLSHCEIEEHFHEWFPAAFEEEWEIISLIPYCGCDGGFYLQDWTTGNLPFLITPHAGRRHTHEYKISDGKIWRRKA